MHSRMQHIGVMCSRYGKFRGSEFVFHPAPGTPVTSILAVSKLLLKRSPRYASPIDLSHLGSLLPGLAVIQLHDEWTSSFSICIQLV
jgi:hypothetical protein